MDGIEEKLGAILGNPQLMEQIMSMAGSLSSPPPEQIPHEPPCSIPDFDPAMIQKLMGLVGNLNVNDNQRALLQALRPYLTEHRIRKLEKAMRAAKLANAASGFLGSGGLSLLTGR